MERRWLGKTGIKINPLGFGGIPVQRISSEEAKKVIQSAIESGIEFFDTARGYTDSEYKIGLGIKGFRDEVILATKSPALTYQDMKADIQKSLEQLDVDYIDLYQVHNIRSEEDFHQLMSPDGGYKAMIEAREAGIIKHIGVTGHDVDLLTRIIKTGKFETVQVPFNALEDQAKSELFPLAIDRDIAIIVMKPLAGGAFRNPDLALRYILEHEISVVIPGMDSIEQLQENLKTVTAPPLTSKEREKLFEEARSLGKEFCRRCGYCLPCPEGIDIPTVFILEGYYSRYNMPDWAAERYAGLKVRADSCKKCGLCEERCPYQLPIKQLLEKAHSTLV